MTVSTKTDNTASQSREISLEVIRNTRVRLDDWRLSVLMQEIQELALASFGIEADASLLHQADGRMAVLVEKGSNVLCGYISYNYEEDELTEENVMTIGQLAVPENFRVFGFGRLLVAIALDAARQSSKEIRKVKVLAVNDSGPFYHAMGFKKPPRHGPRTLMAHNLEMTLPEAPALPEPFVFEDMALVLYAFGSDPFVFDDRELVYSAFGCPGFGEKKPGPVRPPPPPLAAQSCCKRKNPSGRFHQSWILSPELGDGWQKEDVEEFYANPFFSDPQLVREAFPP
eukprot:gnl/TRDRNA2_/TRDRNA2_176425_c13_seq1.p1 gnl/TRDRNA2_/TRDRNA2_176425_c13~~gnl/TRDRNA2_/TRDRNA2_176425_c13_seq1.p1  ORF type:complete len:285 (+),score=42.98 gnl/TRDRNA2_/TRDRNA2_176425_c13_seq1:16-870(+)